MGGENEMKGVVYLCLISIYCLVCVAADETKEGDGWKYFCYGNCSNVRTQTIPSLILEGGGTDQDVVFRYLVDRAGGGNIVVVRSTGTDAYNKYIFDLEP